VPCAGAPRARTTVGPVLHPVGPLPAAVYWRRRLLVLTLLLAVLGGGGWLLVSLVAGSGTSAAATGSTTTSAREAGPPALDRVVPSLASVQTPTPPPGTTPPAAGTPAAPAPPEQEAGGVCGDGSIGLEVRTPGEAPSGASVSLELVVTNTASVPCTRALDAQLQEMVLVDAAGARLWGSNDCQPGSSSDTRTLQPGEQVVFPLSWTGLTSEPTCTAQRVPVAPGDYVVRARLDAKTSPDAPLRIR
jgi:uncharacterized protein DUF4232